MPGVVAGMEEAHRRHAKWPWQELLGPGIELAGEGLAVDWWTTLPMKFACPSVVLRDGGSNSGATETSQPCGDAVAERRTEA